MASKRKRARWITPRRLGAVGCLVGLGLFVAFGYVLYRQMRSLFQPAQRRSPGEIAASQDVKVERGTISDGVHTYGVVSPAREASLGFRLARGKVKSVAVEPGQAVRAGQVLVELDATTLESDLAQARSELLTARKKLEELAGASAEAQRLRLELEVRDARTALDKAQRELAAYDAGQGTPLEKRARAEEELAGARAALVALRESSQRQAEIERLQWVYNQAEVKHGEMVLIANPSEKDRDVEWLLRNDMLAKREALETARLRYEMDVRAAEQRVALAERALETLVREIAAGSPAAERAKKAAAVKVAQAALDQAQARLEAAGKGVLDVEVARAQATVLRLEGAVADAEAALAEARLVAPFDGLIDEVKTSAESTIGSPSPVVTVVDVSSLGIVARVSDIDVARLKAGQEVQVTFDAFRGQPPVTGRLGEIPLYGSYEGGITFFDVPVTFQAGKVPLRAGMTANLYIPLEQKENVLVIPAAAVRMDERGSYVLVVRGGRTERRTVKVGANDGTRAEVVSGLQEGDTVRVPLQGPIGPGGMWMGG